MKADMPADVARVQGFISWSDEEMKRYYDSMGFSMLATRDSTGFTR